MSDYDRTDPVERLARLLGGDTHHEHRTPQQCDDEHARVEGQIVEALDQSGCTCPAMIEVRVYECPSMPTTLKVSHQPWCAHWRGKLFPCEVGTLEIARSN